MDELSLLEADSIEAAEAIVAKATESALPSRPAPDFTGSLDYIDSLASRTAFTVSQRDIANIASAAYTTFRQQPLLDTKAVLSSSDDEILTSTDFRPLGDARRFDPESSVRPPRALVRSASRVLVSPIPIVPGWRPKTPDLPPNRWREDWDREAESIDKDIRRSRRQPFSRRRFSNADQVIICLKRKIRRNVMHAFGYAGQSGFRPPTRTYWSKVIC